MPIWIIIVAIVVFILFTKPNLFSDLLNVLLWALRAGWKLYMGIGILILLISFFN